MLSQISMNSLFSEIKLHFCIQKRVQYGQAIYVCGNLPQIGEWNPDNAFRLSWNKDNYWSGTVKIPAYVYERFEFKYVIGDWINIQLQQTEWEHGQNRQISIENEKRSILCNHKWNKEKVTFYLQCSTSNEEEDYYIVGNVSELGRWRINNKMKKVSNRNFSKRWDMMENVMMGDHKKNQQSHCNQQNTRILSNGKFIQKGLTNKFQKKEVLSIQQSGEYQIPNNSNLQIFQFSFYIYKGRQSIQYLYVKRGHKLEAERYPGRILNIVNPKTDTTQNRQNRVSVQKTNNGIEIFDESRFNELIYSQITPNIMVGCYLKSGTDLKTLKQKGVTDVFCIQTESDHLSHKVSPFFLRKKCEEQGIRHHCCEIEDKNPRDFVEKSLKAFVQMKKIMDRCQKIYVHCSAGVYRSPQIIALYLVLVEGRSVYEAIKTIKEKHPHAKPSYSLICSALNHIMFESMRREEQRSRASF